MSVRPTLLLLTFASIGLTTAHAQTVRYVDDDAWTGGDGVAWTTAYKYVQDALWEAGINGAITEIRVAQGTYKPDQDEGGHVMPGVRWNSFELISGVTLRGGYAGIGAPDPDAWDIEAYETILSGDLAGDDGPNFANYAENSYHVAVGSSAGATAVLDGCTVTSGNADGITASRRRGAGFFAAGGSPTLRNCVFRNNLSEETGGGLEFRDGSTSVVMGCAINGNRANAGAGVYVREANLTLIGCAFAGNRAEGRGGGMRLMKSVSTLLNCTFSGNVAGGPDAYGGGLQVQWESNATVTNCTFVGNSATVSGGGVGIADSAATITNSVLWGNNDSSGAGEPSQLFLFPDGSAVVNYCCVQGWTGAFGGVGNIGQVPWFWDADGPDGVGGTGDEDLRLYPGSAGIDAGDNAVLPADTFDLDGDFDTTEPVPLDLAGRARFVDDRCTTDTGNIHPAYPALAIVDIGAHELQTISPDADSDGVGNCVDNCALHANAAQSDCDSDGLGDVCGLAIAYAADCNTNALPDECDIAQGSSTDCDFDGVPDECVFGDCNTNGVPDVCDVLAGTSDDCNTNLIPDMCDLLQGTSADINSNGIPDECQPRVLLVPQEYPTIQEGINAATPVDTVLVAPGIYTGTGNRALDFGGKDLSLECGGSPTECVIDCEFFPGDGIIFQNGETAQASVQGFRIKDAGTYGPGTYGYGIRITNSSPTITNCMVTGCGGGGILISSESSPAINGCIITDNAANNGGGISVYPGEYAAYPSITNCTIANNTAETYGGGVRFSDTTSGSPSGLDITNCILWGNSAPYGPQLAVNAPINSDVTASYCDLQDGTSAAYLYPPANGFTWGPGLIEADPLFVSTSDVHLLSSNSPCVDAGHNAAVPPDLTIDIDGEPRMQDAGGLPAVVDLGADEYHAVSPDIVASPEEFEFLAPIIGVDPPDQVLSIQNSGVGTLNWQIVEDCPWLQANPTSGDCTNETDQVVLSANVLGLSPGLHYCGLDITDPNAVNDPFTIHVRIRVADAPGVLPVPSSWFAAIQDAVDASIAGDTVLVETGTYTGTRNRDVDFGGKDVLLLCAGPVGSCIIDCQNNGRGFYFHSGETQAAVVDGFTVFDARGGGIRCDASSPTIRNCTIRDCGDPLSGGGGIRCDNASPVIDKCIVQGNSHDGSGGGIGCFGSGIATITDCTIQDNLAFGGHGGGIYCGSAVIENCIIRNNHADWEEGFSGGRGGGIRCGGNTTIKNCLIASNLGVVGGGGGVYVDGGAVNIVNSTIAYNQTASAFWHGEWIPGNGGGLYVKGTTSLANTILWGNADGYQGNGPEAYVRSGGELSVSYSDVRNGQTDIYLNGGTLNWGVGNITDDPLFVQSPSDLHLTSLSPCIDAGDPGYVPQPGETDLDGNPRVCRRLDMGAYESPIMGDDNSDCVIDLQDYPALSACLTGPDSGPYGGGCETFDFELDGDVDLEDVAEFQAVFAP